MIVTHTAKLNAVDSFLKMSPLTTGGDYPQQEWMTQYNKPNEEASNESRTWVKTNDIGQIQGTGKGQWLGGAPWGLFFHELWSNVRLEVMLTHERIITKEEAAMYRDDKRWQGCLQKGKYIEIYGK